MKLRVLFLLTFFLTVACNSIKIRKFHKINFKEKDSQEVKIFEEQQSKPIIVLYHVFKSEKSKILKKKVNLLTKITAVFPQTILLEINCDQFSKKCHDEDIEKYPTLQLRHKGNSHIFNEKFNFKIFYRFLRKKLKGSPEYIGGYKSFLQKKEKLNKREIFMLYVGSFKGMRFKIFESLKQKLNVEFYYTFNKRLKKRIKSKNGDYYLISRHEILKFDEKPILKNMEYFIFQFKFPNLMRPTKEFKMRVFSNETPALIYFTKNDDPKIFKILEKIAQKFHDFMIVAIFTVSKMEKKDYEFYYRSLNLRTSKLPALRYFVADGLNIKKYKPSKKKWNFKHVSSFLQRVIEGKITPYYKSEKRKKISGKGKKGGKKPKNKLRRRKRLIRKIVGDQFLQLLRKETRNEGNVVLLAHGDFDKDQESRKAFFKFKRIVKKIKKKMKNLRFWMINGELNELPGVNFAVLPKFYKFFDFENFETFKEGNYKNLESFISKNSSRPLPDIDL